MCLDSSNTRFTDLAPHRRYRERTMNIIRYAAWRLGGKSPYNFERQAANSMDRLISKDILMTIDNKKCTGQVTTGIWLASWAVTQQRYSKSCRSQDSQRAFGGPRWNTITSEKTMWEFRLAVVQWCLSFAHLVLTSICKSPYIYEIIFFLNNKKN